MATPIFLTSASTGNRGVRRSRITELPRDNKVEEPNRSNMLGRNTMSDRTRQERQCKRLGAAQLPRGNSGLLAPVGEGKREGETGR